MKTYCSQNYGDCETCSLVNHGRDCRNIPLALFAERKSLTDKERELYSPEDFPGSKQWRIHQKALHAVLEFNRKHPEIKAELKAQQQVKDRNKADIAGWI